VNENGIPPEVAARVWEAVSLLAKIKEQQGENLYLDMRTDTKKTIHTAITNKGAMWTIATCHAVLDGMGIGAKSREITMNQRGLRTYVGETALGTRVRLSADCCMSGDTPILAEVPVTKKIVTVCGGIAKRQGWKKLKQDKSDENKESS